VLRKLVLDFPGLLTCSPLGQRRHDSSTTRYSSVILTSHAALQFNGRAIFILSSWKNYSGKFHASRCMLLCQLWSRLRRRARGCVCPSVSLSNYQDVFRNYAVHADGQRKTIIHIRKPSFIKESNGNNRGNVKARTTERKLLV